MTWFFITFCERAESNKQHPSAMQGKYYTVFIIVHLYVLHRHQGQGLYLILPLRKSGKKTTLCDLRVSAVRKKILHLVVSAVNKLFRIYNLCNFLLIFSS